MKAIKTIISFAVLLIMLSSATGVFASRNEKIKTIYSQPVYPSYTFSNVGKGKLTPSPSAYLPKMLIDSEALGTDLVKPVDLFCAPDGSFYIVDSGKNAIICTDHEFNFKYILTEFDNNGKKDTFSAPEGIFVAKDNTLYIADTAHSRIVVLNPDKSLKMIVERPQSEILAENFKFMPKKLAVDSSNRIYVICQGAYEGIMEFYANGSFSGFMGSIPVKPDPLLLFWKSVMSKEQTEKMERFVPVEFTNLSLDSEGFFYTVSLSSTNSEPVRRLNPSGKDILIRKPLAGTQIAGDVIIDAGASEKKEEGNTTDNKSTFIDITQNSDGIYFALDLKKGRAFCYDYDGNLLFVFGGPYSSQEGTFSQPSAIEMWDDNICVMDSIQATITVFSPTAYAKEVLNGLKLYQQSKYDDSIKAWEEVLKFNSNFELAYSKIGTILLRKEDYKNAMEYFELSYDQKNYSKALFYYRRDYLRANLGTILTIAILSVLGLTILIKVVRRLRKRRAVK